MHSLVLFSSERPFPRLERARLRDGMGLAQSSFPVDQSVLRKDGAMKCFGQFADLTGFVVVGFCKWDCW